MQAGVFCFLAGGSSILNSMWHVWQWNEEAMLCEIHMHDLKSHFQQDFLAYCTRPVSVHLAMACIGCLFDSFSNFWLSLKQHQNMKIIFSCIQFPIWPSMRCLYNYVHRLRNKFDGGRKGVLFCCYFQFYMPNTEFTQISIILMHLYGWLGVKHQITYLLMHLCFRTPKSPTVLSACYFQQKHSNIWM